MSVEAAVVGFTERLRTDLASRTPGESVWISRTELPELPQEWERTLLGTPLWIAKPGSSAQYRSGALHAYEFDGGYDFHRDRCDPREDPLGHFFLDAPELPIAGLIAGIVGFLTYLYLEQREEGKDEDERRWWLPLVVAAGVAVVVGIVSYILGAFVRIGLAGG